MDANKREQCGAPKSPPVLSGLFETWSPATSVTIGVLICSARWHSGQDRMDGLLATDKNEVPAIVAIEELPIANNFPLTVAIR